MTRVNVIPPVCLRDKHLVAEYREITRVVTLACAAYARGESPLDPRNPREYTLGKGHVRFFYRHLSWVVLRHIDLVHEMGRRGYHARIRTIALPNRDEQEMRARGWMQGWKPSRVDAETNLCRIAERGGLREGYTSFIVLELYFPK